MFLHHFTSKKGWKFPKILCSAAIIAGLSACAAAPASGGSFGSSGQSGISSGYDSSYGMSLEDLLGGLSGSYGGSSYGNSYGGSYSNQPQTTQNVTTSPRTGDDVWSIYWYLCGSDLESRYSAATQDIQEMLKVKLPENVQVIIETGGAKQWHFNNSNRSLTRYLYNSDGFFQLGQVEQADMGNPKTLADFLKYCKTNFPSGHQMVLFWNHGGGSVNGAEFDELHNYDSLTLYELHNAFDQVYDLDAEDPPFDLVGFDACLMATVDTANTFKDIAKYMVASEEVEPGCGWYYTAWLDYLAKNPDISPAALGKAICDSYAMGCRQNRVGDEITLSVVDLSKANDLFNAYNNLGKEALYHTLKDRSFFAQYGRAASQSENYGGNTASQGYANMVDLGHLVRNSQKILPKTSQDVLDTLEDCVVYQVNGRYHNNATGLSCYHTFKATPNEVKRYQMVGASDAFKQLYKYAIIGNIDEDVVTYLFNNNTVSNGLTAQSASTFNIKNLSDHPVTVNSDGNAVLAIGKEAADHLSGVYAELAYFDVNSDQMIKLGRDDDLDKNWKKGIFTDNFRGVWGSIDGHLVYMELVNQGDDYNTYSVPILLNGDPYNLRVAYNFDDDSWKILGARKGLSDQGAADKNLLQLKPGDKITTVMYASTMDEDDAFQQYPTETFTVTRKTKFAEMGVGDGQFVMFFEMVTPNGKSALSAPVVFTVDGDDIYTTTEFD